MSIWGKLFGSESVIEKATDGIYNGIDKVFYTDEEKADNFKNILKLYEPFKIAQRYLAVIFCIPYALAWLVTFFAGFFIDVSTQFAMLTNPVGMPVIVGAIVIFYFGGGTINSLKGK